MQTLLKQESKIGDVAQTTPNKVFLTGALVFLFTLTFTIAFHFASAPPNKTLCFDARQYFFDTGRITEFLLAGVHGHWRPELVTDQQFLTSILTDGPAFPGFFGTLFALTGHVPSIQDCKLIEIFQSVLHSLSSLMLFALTWALTRRITAAASAGVIWGLYPAAVFWSGIYYTETTVIFFSLLFVSCLAMSRRLAAGFAAGVFGAFVALLKPALLPAAGLASLLGYRLSKKSFALLVLAAGMTVAPWFLYTKSLTGHGCITAQRFPAFNLAMGSDTEVDACLVSPAPPLTTMFSHDDDMPLAFPLSQWQFHTADLLRLTAVKLSALWSRQANDFRQTFLGIGQAPQNIWHLFLLFSGITGVGYAISAWRSSKFSNAQQTIVLAALVFICSHFSYILFTPAARYGLTAMPFFVMFACFAWSAVFSNPQRKTIFAAATVSALIVLGLVNASSLSTIFKPHEFSHRMLPGEAAVKLINLEHVKAPQLPVYSVLLLVDGDAGLENVAIEINGHKLQDHLQHIRNFDSTLYQQSFELRSLGYPTAIATDAFRHWRAVQVPKEWIKWSGNNEIKLTSATTPVKLYGEPAASRHMLATNYFSVNSLCNSDDSLDLRLPSQILSGNVDSTSTIRSGILNDTRLDDSLRIKLAVALGDEYKNPSAEQSSTQLFASTISPKQFDLYIQDPTVNGVRANRTNMKAARSMGTTIDLPEIHSASMLRVRVEGDIRGKNKGSGEVVVALQPAKQGATVVLNMTPANIDYNSQWRHFQIEDMMPAKLLADQKNHSLYLAVYPGPWLDYCGYVADKHCGDAQYKNIKIQIDAADKPDIAGKRILYY